MTDALRGDGPRSKGTSQTVRIAAAIDRILMLIEGTAIVVLLLALIVSVLVQVISRYIMNVSSPWTEEFARYFFIWVSMLGAALGVQRGSHFGFDAVVKALPPWGRTLSWLMATAAAGGMAGVITAQGWRLVILGTSDTGPATNVPMPLVYAAIPVGGALMVAHILLSLFRAKDNPIREGGGRTC
jgi:TRAP-type C4-dicarboxylate transport system permease small subunit